jgi:plasmid stability protein
MQNGGHVATLNIKNLPDGLYRRLKARAKSRHRSVAQEVTEILSRVLTEPEPLSILELRGLGKERWKGIDADEYVRSLREEWD